MSGPFPARAMAGVVAIATALFAPAAHGQEWPAKPVKIIAPFAAGGNADTLARILGQKLSERLGQQFYIENVAGNAGTIGSAAAQRSEPDGYTLVVSGLASHVIAPLTNANVKYHPVADFTHVAMLGGSPLALMANPAIGVKSFAELITYLKRSAAPPAYSSSGAGSHAHLTGEYLQQLAGVRMSHVAYRGGGQAMTDLIGNHVSMGVNSIVAAGSHIRAGTLVGLALTAPERLENFPNVPTFAELGYAQLTGTTWFDLAGPKGMPDSVVQKLNREIAGILARQDIRERFKGEGLVAQVMDPATLLQYYKDEIARWGQVVKMTDLKVQ
jgi:tripartite-type tricarboxylate transporter receptor subunit TctC